MHEDPKEFEKLRKLIALKRHEIPPPGYFDSFSDKVISRIESDDLAHVGIWQQIVSLFKTRPAISWSFSFAAVMTLFVASSGFENHPGTDHANSLPSVGNTGQPAAAASMVFSTNDSSHFGSMRIAFEPTSKANTNSEPKLDSLFSTPFYHQVQPASFSP